MPGGRSLTGGETGLWVPTGKAALDPGSPQPRGGRGSARRAVRSGRPSRLAAGGAADDGILIIAAFTTTARLGAGCLLLRRLVDLQGLGLASGRVGAALPRRDDRLLNRWLGILLNGNLVVDERGRACATRARDG